MRSLRRILTVILQLLTLTVFLAGCGGSTGSTTSPTATNPPTVALKVFAAASLTESFNEIKTKYEVAHSNVKITYNFAGSQLLAQQINSGANADIFASADTANMKKVSDTGATASSQIFAQNKLTVILPASNPAKITTLKDLDRKGIKIVVAAPSVPVGKYSLQVLDKMAKDSTYGPAYESAVKANFVSQEDNVKSVVQKVQLGEADAGIVYRTDVTPNIASKVKTITIPDQFNVIAQYPIAVLKNSVHSSDAQALVQYIVSADGQAILNKYGFLSSAGS